MTRSSTNQISFYNFSYFYNFSQTRSIELNIFVKMSDLVNIIHSLAYEDLSIGGTLGYVTLGSGTSGSVAFNFLLSSQFICDFGEA